MRARNWNGPAFAKLTGETSGSKMCPIDEFPGHPWMNMFAEGALSNAYGWQPEIWNTPNDDELANLEASLCLPGLCFGGFSSRCPQHVADRCRARYIPIIAIR